MSFDGKELPTTECWTFHTREHDHRRPEIGDLVLDPTCAVACRRLLTDRSVSPLFDETVPREDIHSWIVRIRDGFSPRGGAPLAP